MDRAIEQLTEIGLSEKEALVYRAALMLGPTAILRLSRAAGTKRATTYALVDALVAKGLMRKESEGLKQRFVAEDPENLRLVAEQTVQAASQVIPELSALYKKAGTLTPIRIYEGRAGLRSVYDQIMREARRGDPHLFIGGALGWKDVDPAWHERYLKWRSRIHVKARSLFQDSARADLHLSLSRSLRQEVRTVRQDVRLDADILITSTRVAIMRLSHPPTAIVIEDQEIVRTYGALFELLWHGAATVERTLGKCAFNT